ncbi:MAG: hypothetical protein K2W96_26530 [Gemmataceae bacterium]|nr:hypothetical protein [Gemmataceae bacterium]
MSTVLTQHDSPVSLAQPTAEPKEVILYEHSPIFYWWPVWAVGYVFALLTLMFGQDYTFTIPQPAAKAEAAQEGEAADRKPASSRTVRIHPNPALGVLFTFTFFLVIVITHFSVRGTASLTAIVGGIALALFFAYMQWWDDIIESVRALAIFMNLGFYVVFSTALLTVWASAVFFFDRFTYWNFKPGQMIYHSVLGDGEQTFDTGGMSVDKKQDDIFRHWILGLGTGDVHIMTTGAKRAEFTIRNVIFVGSKLAQVQQLVAMKPDQKNETVLTVGNAV